MCSIVFSQDVMHNQDVSRLVLDAAGRSFLTTARELCAEAMILGSTDNVTALVVDLRYRCCGSCAVNSPRSLTQPITLLCAHSISAILMSYCSVIALHALDPTCVVFNRIVLCFSASSTRSHRNRYRKPVQL